MIGISYSNNRSCVSFARSLTLAGSAGKSLERFVEKCSEGENLETFDANLLTQVTDVVAQKCALLRYILRYILDVTENPPDPHENEYEKDTDRNDDDGRHQEKYVHFQELAHGFSILHIIISLPGRDRRN